MAGLSIKADKADQYERFLVEHRKLYPELWTEEDGVFLFLNPPPSQLVARWCPLIRCMQSS